MYCVHSSIAADGNRTVFVHTTGHGSSLRNDCILFVVADAGSYHGASSSAVGNTLVRTRRGRRNRRSKRSLLADSLPLQLVVRELPLPLYGPARLVPAAPRSGSFCFYGGIARFARLS